MATTKEIRISQLPLEKNISGLSTIGVNSANQSVRVPLGEVMDQAIATEAQQRADADAALQAKIDNLNPNAGGANPTVEGAFMLNVKRKNDGTYTANNADCLPFQEAVANNKRVVIHIENIEQEPAVDSSGTFENHGMVIANTVFKHNINSGGFDLYTYTAIGEFKRKGLIYSLEISCFGGFELGGNQFVINEKELSPLILKYNLDFQGERIRPDGWTEADGDVWVIEGASEADVKRAIMSDQPIYFEFNYAQDFNYIFAYRIRLTAGSNPLLGPEMNMGMSLSCLYSQPYGPVWNLCIMFQPGSLAGVCGIAEYIPSIPEATHSSNGLMSMGDKQKLDNLPDSLYYVNDISEVDINGNINLVMSDYSQKKVQIPTATVNSTGLMPSKSLQDIATLEGDMANVKKDTTTMQGDLLALRENMRTSEIDSAGYAGELVGKNVYFEGVNMMGEDVALFKASPTSYFQDKPNIDKIAYLQCEGVKKLNFQNTNIKYFGKLANTSAITDWSHTFSGVKCDVNTAKLDTSGGTNFEATFRDTNVADVSPLDISNALTLRNFTYNSLVKKVNVNAPKCKDFGYAFSTNRFSSFDTTPDVNYMASINTSSGEVFSGMFGGNILVQRISFLLDTSKAKTMDYMFFQAFNLEELTALEAGNVLFNNKGIGDGSSRSGTYGMFESCLKLVHFGGLRNIKVSYGISHSPLSKESKINCINGLYDWTNNPDNADKTQYEPNPSLHLMNISDLTPEEIAIATAKGWNITSSNQ